MSEYRWQRAVGWPPSRFIIALATLGTFAAQSTADVVNGTCSSAIAAPPNFTVVPIGQADPSADFETPFCVATGHFHNSCWYFIDAPADGIMTVGLSTTDPLVDPVLSILSSCGSGSEFACNDDAVGTCALCSVVTFSVIANARYYLAAGTYNAVTNPSAYAVLSVAFEPSSCGIDLSCCIGHYTPNCSDPECCEQVCLTDPVCCVSSWDGACTQAARALCGICLTRDCDANGVDDSVQFSVNSHIALGTSIFTPDTNAWCPTPSATSPFLAVISDYTEGGSTRFVTLPSSVATSWEGLIVRDCDAALVAQASIAHLSLGSKGAVIASSAAGRSSDASILDIEVTTSSNVEIGAIASKRGRLLLTGASSVDANQLNVIDGKVEVWDAVEVRVNSLSVKTHGELDIRGTTSTQASVTSVNDCTVQGLLTMAGGSLEVTTGVLSGPSAASWMRGFGIVHGDVYWNGCVKHSNIIIDGALRFSSATNAPTAKLLFDPALAVKLEVGAAADLNGTLVFDGSVARPSAGSTHTVLSSESALTTQFDGVEVRGLAPELGVFMSVRPQGKGSALVATVAPTRQTISFGSTTAYSLNAKTMDLVRGDFDNDGKEDVAMTQSASPTAGGVVAVYRGTGSGLVASGQFAVGVDPRGIAAADFDGDGRTDLVVALAGQDAVRVLKNVTTSGTSGIQFTALTPIAVGDMPVDVCVGDFFGSSPAKLAGGGKGVAVAVQGSGTLVALRNEGGTVSANGASITPSQSGPPTSVGGGDVDNDRDDDIVGGGSGGTTVVPGGTPTGDSFAVTFIPSPHPVKAIEIVDLTGDGVPEIVATLQALAPRPTPPGTPHVYDSLAIMRAQGLSFHTTLMDVGVDPAGLTTGDLDGDGDTDLALSTLDSDSAVKSAHVVRNDSTASGVVLTLSASIMQLNDPKAFVAVSIDGSADDLAALEPLATGGESQQLTLVRTANPHAEADLNNDGVVDAADLKILLVYWGMPGLSDVNGDGITNAADITVLLTAWGMTS